MDVTFTGPREGMTQRQRDALRILAKALDAKEAINFHHGDCIGADAEAHVIVYPLVWVRVILHPCDIAYMRAYCLPYYGVHPSKPPLVRNKDMVNVSELLIAAPKSLTEVRRSGTWSTIRYARKMKIPVIILDP